MSDGPTLAADGTPATATPHGCACGSEVTLEVATGRTPTRQSEPSLTGQRTTGWHWVCPCGWSTAQHKPERLPAVEARVHEHRQTHRDELHTLIADRQR